MAEKGLRRMQFLISSSLVVRPPLTDHPPPRQATGRCPDDGGRRRPERLPHHQAIRRAPNRRGHPRLATKMHTRDGTNKLKSQLERMSEQAEEQTCE